MTMVVVMVNEVGATGRWDPKWVSGVFRFCLKDLVAYYPVFCLAFLIEWVDMNQA
jgi:hypothetical protein